MAATQHYAIQPKSDLVLLYGLARILIERGWIDREFIAEHTNGFEAFEEFSDAGRAGCPQPAAGDMHLVNGAVRRPRPTHATSCGARCSDTGLSVEQLHHLAETIHRGKRVSFWWTMGVNQGHEATRTAQAIINLALMTGNIGRPGTGANSITGQCNAMGSRLFSNTTNLLGGHDFTKRGASRKSRAHVAHSSGEHSATEQLGLRSDHRRHRIGKNQRALDHRHEHGALMDSAEARARTVRQTRFSRRAGHVCDDRDGAAGASRPAGGGLGREGRHVHQLRAALRFAEKSRTRAGAGFVGLQNFPAHRALLGLRGVVSQMDFAGSGVSDFEEVDQRSAVRHHGHSRLPDAG